MHGWLPNLKRPARRKGDLMFRRFSPRAREVVISAQQEARALHHNYIGTEHILLGLLRDRDGMAAGLCTGWGSARRPCESRSWTSSAKASRSQPGTSR